MTPEQQQLFESNMEWALRFVRPSQSIYYSALRNSALIGLWRAVMKFDPEEDDFRYFAPIYIKGEIRDEYARWFNYNIGGRKTRIQYELSDSDAIRVLVGAIAEETISGFELKELVEEALDLHTEEEQFFLRELFLNEKTMLQIDTEQGQYAGWARYQFTKLFQGLIKPPWNRDLPKEKPC